MKRSLCLSLALVFLMSATAWAEGSNYASVRTGASLITIEDIELNNLELSDDEKDSTFALGFAIGRDLSEDIDLDIRVELEYMYRTDFEWNDSGSVGANNWDASVDVNAQTVFFNAYYDFKNETDLTPYVGFGLGASWLDAEVSGQINYEGATYSDGYDNTETNFAWNVAAGCSYAINEDWAIDAMYRYVDLGEASVGVNGYEVQGDATAHEFLLGVRYMF